LFVWYCSIGIFWILILIFWDLKKLSSQFFLALVRIRSELKCWIPIRIRIEVNPDLQPWFFAGIINFIPYRYVPILRYFGKNGANILLGVYCDVNCYRYRVLIQHQYPAPVLVSVDFGLDEIVQILPSTYYPYRQLITRTVKSPVRILLLKIAVCANYCLHHSQCFGSALVIYGFGYGPGSSFLDECGSGSRSPSNADPDPKHWSQYHNAVDHRSYEFFPGLESARKTYAQIDSRDFN
jgi:hypothetical protein